MPEKRAGILLGDDGLAGRRPKPRCERRQMPRVIALEAGQCFDLTKENTAICAARLIFEVGVDQRNPGGPARLNQPDCGDLGGFDAGIERACGIEIRAHESITTKAGRCPNPS